MKKELSAPYMKWENVKEYLNDRGVFDAELKKYKLKGSVEDFVLVSDIRKCFSEDMVREMECHVVSFMFSLEEPEQPKMSKIKMALEILEALEFLGIDKEEFPKLKEQSGSLEQLHSDLGDFLAGDTVDHILEAYDKVMKY